MWRRLREALRKKQLSDAGEMAVAEALDVEGPAQVWRARKAKCRRLGILLARFVAGGAFIALAVHAIENARLGGLIDATQEGWLIYVTGFATLRIVAPEKFRIWVEFFKTIAGGLWRALKALFAFFHWSSDGFFLLGLIAFYGAVFAMMACGTVLGFENARWLTESEHASQAAWLPTLNHGVIGCVSVVIIYRLPGLNSIYELPLFIAKACFWIVANFIASGMVLQGFGKAHETIPPSFDAMPSLIVGFMTLGALMFIVALNHSFFVEHVVWFGTPSPLLAPGYGDGPPRARPNLLN